MDAASLLRLFRAEVRDEHTPYLWSDAEALVYINEAQTMFARLTGGIPDAHMVASSPAGGGYFVLPPELMKVKAVELPAERRSLAVLNYEDLQYRADYASWQRTPPSAPTSIVIGDLEGHAMLYPPNIAAVELKIVGYRLPKEPIINLSDDLEIRPEHQYSLLLWMKHLAHTKQDAETFDRGRAEEFAKQFAAYCQLARAEQERRDHKPRAILYGGIL